jgi:hypothetical protein
MSVWEFENCDFCKPEDKMCEYCEKGDGNEEY